MNKSSSSSPSSSPVLDVRSIPPREKHATIFRTWSKLPVGAALHLVNDHDPVPLHYQFSAEYAGAFAWEYVERGPDVFQVKITRVRPEGDIAPPPPAASARRGNVTDPIREIDARGMEPPEPLMLILAALETLPEGAALHARTDREPCHLFGEAERRGFGHASHEEPDGSWITVLTRA